MKLAHIVPSSLVSAIPDTASAHFCVVSVFNRDQRYANYYREQVRKGKHVILDNPVHEDEGISVNGFFTAAGNLQPTVAILPDVIDDHEKTLGNAKDLIDELKELCPGTMIMAVPHAEDHFRFIDNAAELLELGVQFLGLTLERRLKNDPLAYSRRRTRLRMLRSDPRFDGVNIHYLGVSEFGLEFLTEERELVASADTSKFAARCLIGKPAVPPAPITEPYPGRAALGGSSAYFGFTPEELDDKFRVHFTANLSAWSDYAETGRTI